MERDPGRRPAPRDAPLLPAATVVYALLLIYGSLAPWQDWRAIGVSPFAFLFAPLPRHQTAFDVALNILAYVPLGLLLGLALYPQHRRLTLFAVATFSGSLLSLLLEASQTYLPLRIASNIDLAANVGGSLLGAGLAAVLAPALIDRDRLQQVRAAWFDGAPGAALALALLWPITQFHPTASLFAAGSIDRELTRRLLAWADFQVPRFDAGEFVAAEVLITTAAMLAAGLTLLAAMRPAAPRLPLLATLVITTLAAKAAAYAQHFGAERAFAWLTPGAIGGLLVGSLALLAAAPAPAQANARLAVLATVVLIVAANLLPVNPYHVQWLAQWRPGKLRDLMTAAELVAILWPFALLAGMTFDTLRGARSPR